MAVFYHETAAYALALSRKNLNYYVSVVKKPMIRKYRADASRVGDCCRLNLNHSGDTNPDTSLYWHISSPKLKHTLNTIYFQYISQHLFTNLIRVEIPSIRVENTSHIEPKACVGVGSSYTNKN